MTGNQVHTIGWVAALMMVAGLVLCFSSPSLGTKKALSWLQSQQEGIADASLYTAVAENNMAMFVALGSILFSIGILLAVGTYFAFTFFRKPDMAEVEKELKVE